MADERRQEEARAMGYERRDLDPRSIALFAVGLAVVIGLAAGAVTVFQTYSGSRYLRRQAARPPLTVTRESTEPRLQVNGPAELRTIREGEERTLSSYAWVDPQSETVRIPIERAISILAQKGLPARQEQAARPPASGNRSQRKDDERR
jgi:hypothetical protein